MTESRNAIIQETDNLQPDGSFKMRMGHTTYTVGIHFSKTGSVTYEDKMKRLMREDVKNGHF